MIRATDVKGQHHFKGSAADTVVLDFDDRHRRRMAMTGTRGLEFLLDLENAVALRGENEFEIPGLIEWAHGRGIDVSLIEVMPLGETGSERVDQYLPLDLVQSRLKEQWTLEDIPYRTGGPARYVRIAETGGRLGFITPLTHNFCEGCNRVRVTCTGTLYMCLGQDDAADLRAPLRSSESDDKLHAALDDAIFRKPKGHDFVIERAGQAPAVRRHMSVTGG